MNNKLFPWVILVPMRDDITEIYQLKSRERKLLMDEIALVSQAMKNSYWPDKINVAALGNQVEQLHVHIIARFKTDDAWPQPVWGKGESEYDEQSALIASEKLREACKNIEGFTTIANLP